MTHSDKAREIAATLNNDFIGIDDDGDPFLFKLDAVLIITAALREAENAAYEKAAQVAENHQNHAMGMPQYAASLEIAAAIRALKAESK